MHTGNLFRINHLHFLTACLFLLLFVSCSLHKNAGSTKTNSRTATSGERTETGVNAGETYEPASKKSLEFYQEKYSPMLGNTRQLTDIKLYQFMDQWIETPYQYGGNSKDGIDCSRLSILLLGQVYQKKISGSSADIYNQSVPLAPEMLEAGDVVFFKINSNAVNHMGVYLVNNKFIHATTQAGVLVSDLNETYYRKYFFSAGRIR